MVTKKDELQCAKGGTQEVGLVFELRCVRPPSRLGPSRGLAHSAFLTLFGFSGATMSVPDFGTVKHVIPKPSHTSETTVNTKSAR